MLCQKCKTAEAAVRIGKMKRDPSSRMLRPEGPDLYFCFICAEEYRNANPIEGRALGERQKGITEFVRVMSVTPERTIYRLIRTESDATPEDWSLLTSRVPERPVGTEMKITYTREELEFLRGEGEFG